MGIVHTMELLHVIVTRSVELTAGLGRATAQVEVALRANRVIMQARILEDFVFKEELKEGLEFEIEIF
jgi:hypothetical protein